MEDELKSVGFQSLSIFEPAAIYPGNDNTPSALGALNQSLNFLLPGAYHTVSSEEIGLAMIKTMSQQQTGAFTGVETIVGGAEIRQRAQR
jgi:hypothetical protein